LRLAIGWHFLFEGLHKIHSVYVGPSETSRPFTSEPYFAAAEGPLGPYMRKKLGDPDDQIAAKVGEKNVPEKLAALPPIDRLGRGPEGEPRDVMQTAARHDPAAAAADDAKFAKM